MQAHKVRRKQPVVVVRTFARRPGPRLQQARDVPVTVVDPFSGEVDRKVPAVVPPTEQFGVLFDEISDRLNGLSVLHRRDKRVHFFIVHDVTDE